MRPGVHETSVQSMADLLVYVAGVALVLWGTAHIAPTKPVTASFGDIGVDNRRIFVMEWVAEGITHISIGLLVISLAMAEGSGSSAAQLVYRVVAAALVGLAGLTALTGSRTPVVWFKVCPFVLSGAAALLVGASVIA
jgi:hypothetical protein